MNIFKTILLSSFIAMMIFGFSSSAVAQAPKNNTAFEMNDGEVKLTPEAQAKLIDAGKRDLYFTLGSCALGLAFSLFMLSVMKQAGYKGAILILAFISPINVLLLAFGKWPIQDEIKNLKKDVKQLM